MYLPCRYILCALHSFIQICYHFLYARRNSFNISCSVIWQVIYPFNFICLKKCCFTFVSERHFYRILKWTFFFLSVLLRCCCILLTCTNSDEKQAVIITFVSLYVTYLFGAAFKILSLSLMLSYEACWDLSVLATLGKGNWE